MNGFLANENFPGDAVVALRAAGYQVVWVRSDAPGMADTDVLEWARRERLVLLTFDKDFGELAYDHDLPEDCGIVLFRIPMPKASSVGASLCARILERNDWTGHFSVIEPGRVRMRRLPKASVSST